MEFIVARHGHADYARATDRYSARLSPEGRAQSQRLAEVLRAWDAQFLVASTMIRVEETVDAIHTLLPEVMRWDLQELEEIGVEEPMLDPTSPPRVDRWSAEQLRLARERTWVRVMAALQRVQVYSQTHGLERIAMVAHADTLNLLLANWLGLDWRSLDRHSFSFDWCTTTRVIVRADEVVIAWVNRPT